MVTAPYRIRSVCRVVSGEQWWVCRAPKPRLGPVKEFIDGILELDRRAPRKQRHTTHRIYVRIRQEMPQAEIRSQQSAATKRGEKWRSGGHITRCSSHSRISSGTKPKSIGSSARKLFRRPSESMHVLHARYGDWRRLPLRISARNTTGIPGGG
jgi:hypothetical protein